MKRFYLLLSLCMMLGLSASAATNILGTPQASIDRMYQFVMSKNPGSSFTREIAAEFYNQGVKYGIRGDIALCQSCVETGWFRYTGGTAVTPSDHNYCGLGVTTLGKKGCQFSTIADGVSAQLQHLWAYATTNELPSGWTLIDPRFKYVNRGCAPTWEALGGKWAASTSYGSSILSIYNEMMRFTVANPSLKASVTSVEFTAEQNAAKPSRTITITGQNLTSKIVYNASTSAVNVSTSNWDDFSGGTMTITLDTSKAPGTYTGYVAVQSGSGDSKQRLEIQLSATITAPVATNLKTSESQISFAVTQGDPNPSRTINVTAENLSADISVNSSSSAFTVTKGSNWNPRTGGSLDISFDASRTPGSYTGTLALQSGSTRAQVALSATIAKKPGTIDPDPQVPELSFKEIWNKSQTANDAAWATSVRNLDQANGMLYCVYNTQEIKLIDGRTGAEATTLSNEGISQGTLKLCDVKYLNGKIFACNLSATASTPLIVYRWDNTEATPVAILNTTDKGGAARLGDCLEIWGNPDGELNIAFANDDGSTTRIVKYTRTSPNAQWTTQTINVTKDGAYLPVGVSPRVRHIDGGWWIDAKNIHPTRLDNNGNAVEAYSGEAVTHGNDFATFTYDNRNYILLASYLNNSASTYADGVMRLFDITDSWNATQPIATMPPAGLGSTRNTNTTGSLRINACANCVEAWILATGQGIAYYRSGEIGGCPVDTTPKKPVDPGIVTLPDLFSTDWINSHNGQTISAPYMDLSGVMTRNMALRNNNLYIVKRTDDNANIIIANAMTGAQTGVLPADNAGQGTWRFASVATLNDAVVACNLATSATGALRVYAWTSDTAAPSLLLETTNHGLRAGDLMSAYGSLSSGKLYFASNTGFAGKIFVYTITAGKASPTPQIITLTDAKGQPIDLGGAFAVIEIRPLANGTFYASGKAGYTALFAADGKLIETVAEAAVDSNPCGTSFAPFSFGKYNIAATISYKNSIEQSYLNLVNLSDGHDKATVLNSYAPIGSSGSRNSTFVTTALARVDDKDIHLWAMVPGQGIAKYRAISRVSSHIESPVSTCKPAITFDGSEITVTGADARAIAVYSASGTLAGASTSGSLSTQNLTPGLYIIMAALPDGSSISAKIAIR